MRADIRLALLGDTQIAGILSADGTQEPVIVSPAGGDGDFLLPTPHLILRMGVREKGVGHVFRRELTVWAHDRSGDYSIIDALLNRCRVVLGAIASHSMIDGNWITCIEWTGDSEDGYDDGPGTITRNSTYIIIGSGG